MTFLCMVKKISFGDTNKPNNTGAWACILVILKYNTEKADLHKEYFYLNIFSKCMYFLFNVHDYLSEIQITVKLTSKQ